MAKVKFHYNDMRSAESCPNCGCEFEAMFMESVCEHCGFVSFGCSLCPKSSSGNCYGKDCSCVKNRLKNELFAVFYYNDFFNLPQEYCIIASTMNRNSIVAVMEGMRLVPIYTAKSIFGFTTIDVEEYKKTNDLSKYKKIAELFNEE